MEFTAKEIEAIKLWLSDIWWSDPYKDLLDADWGVEESESIIASVKEKLGMKE